MKGNNRKLVRLGIILGAWTLFGLFFASQYYLGRAYSGRGFFWIEALKIWMPCAYSWAVLTPAILWLIERVPISRKSWKQAFFVHLAAAVFFSLVSLSVYFLVRQLLFWNYSFLTFKAYKDLVIGEFHQGLLIYGTLFGISYALDYYRKYRERELIAAQLQTQLAQAQLAALKAQLHPHFLFNTLNTIAVLMDEDTRLARDMLVRLGDLLRIVLQKEPVEEASLRQEVEFLESYLEIERVRFHDRLKVVMKIDPNALSARVPDLILQPLVENALKHGISPRAAGGEVVIRATRQNGNLLLEVYDDGAGMKEGRPNKGNGVGLANTKARLDRLYGSAHSFEIRNRENGGLVVSLSLPFIEHEQRDSGNNR